MEAKKRGKERTLKRILERIVMIQNRYKNSNKTGKNY